MYILDELDKKQFFIDGWRQIQRMHIKLGNKSKVNAYSVIEIYIGVNENLQ